MVTAIYGADESRSTSTCQRKHAALRWEQTAFLSVGSMTSRACVRRAFGEECTEFHFVVNAVHVLGRPAFSAANPTVIKSHFGAELAAGRPPVLGGKMNLHALQCALVAGVVLWIPVSGVAGVYLTDRPEIALVDSATSDRAIGAEPTIAVDPGNWRILLVSHWGVDGCTRWISANGGATWHGSNYSPWSPGSGDPSAVILAAQDSFPKRYMIQSLGTVESDPVESALATQRVVFGRITTPNNQWRQTFPAPATEAPTDKGFLWANNRVSPPMLYSVWWVPTGSTSKFTRSLDHGNHWETPQALTGTNWGSVIQTSIADSQHVYVVYTSGGTPAGAPASLRLRRSTNRGVSFESPIVIISTPYQNRSFGQCVALPGRENGCANSIPTAATDDLGNLYVAWCQKRLTSGDGSGDDAQVYLSVSSPDAEHLTGDVWDSPSPVSSNSANQWLPAIAWDNDAKALVAVYLDDRADSDSAHVYLAVSYDHGTTFSEVRISGAQNSGGNDADEFLGDYMGLVSAGGVAYPVWTDNRDGDPEPYLSPVFIGGVVTDSIAVSVGPGALTNTVRFEATWRTRVASEGLDKLTVTPHGASAIARSVANVTSAGHAMAIDSIACVAGGNWSYVVESNKGTAVSRSGTLTLLSQASVTHSNVQALVDSIQVTITWTTSVVSQTGSDVVRFYKEVSGGEEVTPVTASYSTSNSGLTHTAVCKITPCAAQQYYYYTATSTMGCAISSSRETSKRFKLTACVEP